jgi:hypothetical protein
VRELQLWRREALVLLMSHLKPNVNLELNAHFLDRALGCDHPRVGVK